MGAAFAYARVLHANPMLTLIRSHETHHAGALATEIGAVGLFTPPPPKTRADLDSASERLAKSAPHVFAAGGAPPGGPPDAPKRGPPGVGEGENAESVPA